MKEKQQKEKVQKGNKTIIKIIIIIILLIICIITSFRTGQKYYDLEFITPTSFKSNGRYMIYPDLGMIYRSLMKKYSIVSEQNMYDEDTLEQLVNYSNITRYRLQSTLFPLEGVVIPSFKGNISVRIHGSDTMSRYARLLLSFGEYSGVGIKSSIGMGAIKLGRMEG